MNAFQQMLSDNAPELQAQYARWTREHEDAAQAQGWCLSDYNTWGLLQIQRIDELEVFETDQQVIDMLQEQAQAGSDLAALALELDTYFEPFIYPDKASEAAAPSL